MEKFIINGGNPLNGEVTISGAKNAAVAILPAALLINGTCTINNLPNISDVRIYCDILQDLGAKITWIDKNTITIDSRNITNTRMRDFYDIHILLKLYGNTLDSKILGEALLATAKKRETERYLNEAVEIFEEVQADAVIIVAYQKKFSYASDISWDKVMESTKELYDKCY